MTKKWYAIIAAVAAISAAALFALSGGDKEKDTEPLKTAKVAIGTLKMEAMANGTVNPEVEVVVKSKAGGEIIDFPFNEGDLVKKGDVVVRLDPQTEEARAKQAEAALLMSEARLEKAGISRKDADVRLQRQRRLFEEGIISRQELDDAEIGFLKAGSDVKLSEAELMQTKEALKEARERLADTKIKAPFAGTVLKKFVDRGQVISSTLSSASEGTQIFSMANLDNIFVTANIDEVDIARIRPGQQTVIKVDSLPEKEFAGVVERVAPKGRTEMTVTVFDVVVRVIDREKSLLRPGMTADVSIVTSVRKDALLVPREAVKTKGAKTGVYVVKGGEPEFVEAETGDTDGVATEIKGGVAEGAEVVTSPVNSENKKENGKRRLFF
ncbi:MAG TPA: hypothetical protein DDW94_06370 [Deltaproteobacteria bacterium]|nr:MAG: hypothetical protein A2Z79_00900 [Deltaproteobacteria bacterium GWA2_55_82]OIJ73997.1 MAG: hypothetical protein A2V21_306810 [Deltaproteobacteria bacterium GWC2_55_46]HBG46602.1 hypothetical protein [Deltaproteobacteria bacterium]HCY11390.1 hypothetical protein [Deltaproteobacteria bacterium]